MKMKIIAVIIIISLFIMLGCTQPDDTKSNGATDAVDSTTLNEVELTADEITAELGEIDDLIASTDLGIEDPMLDENLI